MSYFFSNERLSVFGTVSLKGPEARHLVSSRRVKAGETFELQDITASRYLVRVDSVDRTLESLEGTVVEALETPPEPESELTLAIAFLPEQQTDLILRASVELGATAVVVWNSARVARQMTVEEFEKKQERWERILYESVKQSGRARIPKLSFAKSAAMLSEALVGHDSTWVFDGAGGPPKRLPGSLALVVGPEGGLSPDDVFALSKLPGLETVSLGPYTLRAETAAIAALTLGHL